MPTLDPSLRDQLATVIGKENQDGGARAVAEIAARAALSALAVQLPAPYAHLDTASKELRNRLRARARQLGDIRHADGRHETRCLVEQAAYEHWHRMLFARFLAENDLLIHPEMKVAVTLEECAELAPAEGAVDGWELAGRYASRMLPQIFRPDDPVLAFALAAEHQQELERLLASLPVALFRASDSLGWCYQFWQARRKKEVNASEVKIGADELPAVTQLFTEPYMVQFLLHNTLGAWWVGAGRAPPMEMAYLRRLDDGTPAAGTFAGWPRLARELKVLDPCCGSGHFLVAAFEILVGFRMAEEGLSAREACDAVLRDNLFGLEIDPRCVQIAAFALAMAAWTFPGAGGYRPLAAMSVACSGLAISAKKEEWEALGGENLRLRNGMGRMWELFKDAPVLGSLIDPTQNTPNPIQVARFGELGPMIAKALESNHHTSTIDEFEERVVALGLSDAARILGEAHTLVCTNVPYLSRSKQHDRIRQFCDTHHSASKQDLATAMTERALGLCARGGTVSVVTPQNSLFLTTYSAFRLTLLRESAINLVVALGPAAFCDMNWWAIRTMLFCASRVQAANDHSMSAIDLKDHRITADKPQLIQSSDVIQLSQRRQKSNPDYRIILEPVGIGPLMSAVADSYQGISPADLARFGRQFWEVSSPKDPWRLWQSTVSETQPWGGREKILNMGPALTEAANAGSAYIRGEQAWNHNAVVVSAMGTLPCTLGTGQPSDTNVAVLVPKDPSHLPALWAFCSSTEYSKSVRRIDQALKVTNSTLVKVPFDLSHWQDVAAERYPNGLPSPYSPDPTQWLFTGPPRPATAPLQVAIARLLGFRWPDQPADNLDALADADGIVCIPALRGERPAADRLTELLAAAWGKDWHPQTLTDLLAATGHTGTLEEWLRDAFFKQHCELFHHRPFVWHLWDGHREGFSALVNYHSLDHERLKSLTYSYLGDWIRTVEIEARAGKSGAGDKLARAKALQQKLAAILEGEAATDKKTGLDIFVRWKPLAQQPMGWHPDLDDGVRLNIRPFLSVADVGAKGAGVLRWKPNIKWGIDRGKNPPDAPWGEARDNDRHLTLAEKRAARGD